MREGQFFRLLKLYIFVFVLGIALVIQGCGGGNGGGNGNGGSRIQDRGLGRDFPVPSILQGRDDMFEALVDTDRIDDKSSLSFVLLDQVAGENNEHHSDRVLMSFCYHKPGNCGQDEEGNSLYLPEAAREYVTHTILPGDDGTVNTGELRRVYAGITDSQNENYEDSFDNTFAIIPFAPALDDVQDKAFAIVSADNIRGSRSAIEVVFSQPSGSPGSLGTVSEFRVNPRDNGYINTIVSNNNNAQERSVILGDGSTQAIPILLMVAGYERDGNGDIIASSGSVSCHGSIRTFCVRAPFEVTRLPERIDENDDVVLDTFRGNSYAAPSVAAILYSTSQLWPDLSRDEVVALFISCLRDMGDTGVDSVWGRGIPDLECMSRPQGDTMVVNGRSVQGIPVGIPLSGSFVALSLFEVRFGRTFTGNFIGTRADVNIPSLMFGDFFETEEVFSSTRTLFTEERLEVLPFFSGVDLGGGLSLQPMMAVQEGMSRLPMMGMGVFRTGEEGHTVFGLTYNHPDTFFGLHKGSGSFDPGVLQEIGVVFYHDHVVTSQLTVQVKGSCSRVWSEGRNLVDELSGLGCNADTAFSWRPSDFMAFNFGLHYQKMFHIDYTVTKQSIEVSDVERLGLGLSFSVTF